MDASTIRHAADTVTETVGERLSDLGDAAHRLAAKTPWVEQPAPKSHAMLRWALYIGAVAAVAVLARWWATRRTETAGSEPRGDMTPPTEGERRLTAAVG